MTDLLLLKQKEWGALGIAVAVMLLAAARNPQRNITVIRGIALGLAVAGAAELAALWLLNADRLYPATVTVMHAIVRLCLALFLVSMVSRLCRDIAFRSGKEDGA